MTKHECAVVMAYTGVCMLTGDDQKHFYEYVAELIGRPVYTHEFPGLTDTIEEKAKPDFLELCRTATEPTGQGRHGHWIIKDVKTGHMQESALTRLILDRIDYTAQCSVCGRKSPSININPGFLCPHCGAIMDGADDQRGCAENG